MFERILVPTDFTDKSRKALEIAVRMTRYDARSIILLHVIETIDDVEDNEFEAFYGKLRRKAEISLAELADGYQDKGADIKTEVVLGKRVPEILRYAHEEKIDLIVLGSHRIDLADPYQGWGTISYKVGLLAPCPVMMIK